MDRPKATSVVHPDTRKTCAECGGKGAYLVWGFDSERECFKCSGLGFTGHYTHVSGSVPSADDWRKYADYLEAKLVEAEAENELLRGGIREAMDWNWLDDMEHIPREVVHSLEKLSLPPATEGEIGE